MTNEAFARVKIDQLLKDARWRLTDGRSVRFEYALDDGGKADYALFDRQGRALAVLEAKRTSVNLSSGEAQGRRYADQLGVPFIFLSNGEEIWFCDKDQDAHFRKVETVFSQDDLMRRQAARGIRRSPLDIAIDRRIAGGGGRTFQIACIDTLCREIVNGRRKMLVEMATGTGKTRDRRGADQAPVRGELDHPRAVRRRSQPARHPGRRRLYRAPAASALLPRAARRPAVPGSRSGSRSSRCKRWSTNTPITRPAISTLSSSTSATAAFTASGAARSTISTRSRSG